MSQTCPRCYAVVDRPCGSDEERETCPRLTRRPALGHNQAYCLRKLREFGTSMGWSFRTPVVKRRLLDDLVRLGLAERRKPEGSVAGYYVPTKTTKENER